MSRKTSGWKNEGEKVDLMFPKPASSSYTYNLLVSPRSLFLFSSPNSLWGDVKLKKWFHLIH